MKILLIGGENDGSRIEVNDELYPLQNISLPIREKKMQFSPLRQVKQIKSEDYKLEYLYSGEKKYPVYLRKGENPSEIIPALLAGYRVSP